MNQHWIEKLDPDDARLVVVQALEMCGGEVGRAATRVDTTRLGFWRMLRELGLLNMPRQLQTASARRLQPSG